MIKEAIEKIVMKEDLTYDEAYTVMNEILGGETGRVMIPAGKEAFYTFSAPGPIPEETDQYEVSAFSIARF